MQTVLQRNPLFVNNRLFQHHHWRSAILHYLFGVWSADPEVLTAEPTIFFDGLRLRLNPETRTYSAAKWNSEPPRLFRKELTVSNGQNDVEIGLIRFVKNNQLRLLRIKFPNDTEVCLWKGERPGELHWWSNIQD